MARLAEVINNSTQNKFFKNKDWTFWMPDYMKQELKAGASREEQLRREMSFSARLREAKAR